MPETVALCTAVYPGVESFLGDWYRSVEQQTALHAQIWIAVDGLSIDDVIAHLGASARVNWVQAEAGDTPALVRQRLLARVVETCEQVILVDSDDVLHPQRVTAACDRLRHSDLTGCGLRLVDAQGKPIINTILRLPDNATPETVLPRHNVYGLSNTAWRSSILRNCLPIPDQVEIVDWYLATRAWLCGFQLDFDNTVYMDYRQHGNNMVCVQGPFTSEQVRRDTERVLHHFDMVQQTSLKNGLANRREQLAEVKEDVERFQYEVLMNGERLDRYVKALNSLPPQPLWWSAVAHPSLSTIWS
jgi:hypothetical protein